MRIDGNGRVIGPRGSGVTQKTEGSSSRFSLEMPDESPEAAGAPSAAAVSGLEAMLALQSIEDPLVRRRRAMQRGRGLLDALDALKIGLIDGGRRRRRSRAPVVAGQARAGPHGRCGARIGSDGHRSSRGRRARQAGAQEGHERLGAQKAVRKTAIFKDSSERERSHCAEFMGIQQFDDVLGDCPARALRL